jgi:hypothetical protein
MPATQIILSIVFALLAVGALAFLTRIAANVAGGRFEFVELHQTYEEPEVLRRGP